MNGGCTAGASLEGMDARLIAPDSCLLCHPVEPQFIAARLAAWNHCGSVGCMESLRLGWLHGIIAARLAASQNHLINSPLIFRTVWIICLEIVDF